MVLKWLNTTFLLTSRKLELNETGKLFRFVLE